MARSGPMRTNSIMEPIPMVMKSNMQESEQTRTDQLKEESQVEVTTIRQYFPETWLWTIELSK